LKEGTESDDHIGYRSVGLFWAADLWLGALVAAFGDLCWRVLNAPLQLPHSLSPTSLAEYVTGDTGAPGGSLVIALGAGRRSVRFTRSTDSALAMKSNEIYDSLCRGNKESFFDAANARR